jgi:hypothetical protein
MSLHVLPASRIPRKDEQWKMCTGSRAFNKITIRCMLPLSWMDDLMDSVNGAKYLTKIEFKSGYQQIFFMWLGLKTNCLP